MVRHERRRRDRCRRSDPFDACCSRDVGGPYGAALQGEAPNHREQLPKRGPARRRLHAFQLGLGRLLGLIELLADAQRVVSYTTADGRRFMDLFQSAEPG
jgi:hypothetical protein